MSGSGDRDERASRWRRRLLRIAAGAFGTAVVLAALLMLVFPTQQYMDQQDEIAERRAMLAALRSETNALTEQIRSTQDPIVVERMAREGLGLIRPGDQLYRLSVDPRDALDLPPSWPLPGVRALLTGD